MLALTLAIKASNSSPLPIAFAILLPTKVKVLPKNNSLCPRLNTPPINPVNPASTAEVVFARKLKVAANLAPPRSAAAFNLSLSPSKEAESAFNPSILLPVLSNSPPLSLSAWFSALVAAPNLPLAVAKALSAVATVLAAAPLAIS